MRKGREQGRYSNLIQAPVHRGKEKQRVCLSCGREFTSMNAGNRTCAECKVEQERDAERYVPKIYGIEDRRIKRELWR